MAKKTAEKTTEKAQESAMIENKNKSTALAEGPGISSEDMSIFNEAFEDNLDIGSELQFSRVAILQPLSPEIAEERQGYKAGMLVDNMSREILTDFTKPKWLLESGVPEEDLSPTHNMCFIPVMKLPTEFVKWIPRNDQQPGEQPFEWKTLDRKDPRVIEGVWPKKGGKWGTKEGQKGAPPVTENTNFLILPVDMESKEAKSNFTVLTFSRTSAGAGIRLTNSVAAHRMSNLPPFGRYYFVSTHMEKKDGNRFYVMDISKGGLTKADFPGIFDSVYEMAKELCNKVYGRQLQENILNAAQIHQEEVDAESEVSAADPF